jgi:tetratricopeptide (TPR) repeat protein
MKAKEYEGWAHDVSCSEASAELERLLADERFRATERSRSILKYIAEQQFAGRAEGVKAYSIAIDVLGRQSNFDPSLDPIVRIELSRLRSSLSQYYEAFGEDGGVTVQLPRGRYIAIFTRSTGASPGIEDREHPATTWGEPVKLVPPLPVSAVAPNIQAGSWATLRLAATLALLMVVVVGTGITVYGARTVTTAKPAVTVTLTAVDEGLRDEAAVTRDMLLTALTQFQTLTVSQADRRERPLASVLRPAISNDYAIDMKYYGDGDDRSIWWQVVDTATGDLLKSGLERVDTSGRTVASVREELVAQLARRFAATRGIINNIEAHDMAEGSLGNACVLQAEHELDDGPASGLARTINCLERTIAANRYDADATAALAMLLAAGQAEITDNSKLARALELANRAVSLSPLSDRAHLALMLSQFYSGRIDAAIAAGNRALALNPNNPDVAAKLGLALFALGYFDAGVSLARDAGRLVDVVPRDAVLVLALDAYRRRDWSEASLLAEQASDRNFLIRVLRVAALGQLGSDEAAQRLTELRQLTPDFEATFRERMAQRRYQPLLSASIEEGLAKAGARFTAEGLATAF